MADETLDTNPILEAGASEGSLSPGGGTAAGDIKVNTIADIVSKLGSLSDEDLNHFKQSLTLSVEAGRAAGGAQAANMASIKSSGALKPLVKEDLIKIFGAEEGLSENFVSQATTLFEAALATRVSMEIETLDEEYEDRLNEQLNDKIVQFTERLDTYLDHLAEKFLEDNKVAIETGIRVELAESFLSGINSLLSEHNVEIAEDKVDVVARLEEQVEDLTTKLNEAIDAKLQEEVRAEEREIANVVNSITEGMIQTDKDRLLVMAESISYDDVSDFTTKLSSVKNTFFESTSVAPSDSNGLVLEDVVAIDESGKPVASEVPAVPVAKNPSMSRYMETISRMVKDK